MLTVFLLLSFKFIFVVKKKKNIILQEKFAPGKAATQNNKIKGHPR